MSRQMGHFNTVSTEKVLQNLMHGVAGKSKAYTVGVNQDQTGTGPYSVTPFGMVLDPMYFLNLENQLNSGNGYDESLAAVLHTTAHLRFSTYFNQVKNLKHLSLAVVSIFEDARVERKLDAQIPGVSEIFGHFIDTERALAIPGVEGILAKIICSLHANENIFDDYLCAKALKISNDLLEKSASFEDYRFAGSILANDLGQIRLNFDPSNYRTWPPYRDDNSILWAEKKSAEQVQDVITSREPSPASSEIKPEIEEIRTFFYDEWDYEKNSYRMGHVTVIEESFDNLQKKKQGIKLTPVQEAKRAVVTRVPHSALSRYSEEGELFDIDRTVQRSIDLQCGITPNNQLFKNAQKKRTKVGITVLLDASESANDRLPGTYSSVLDFEKSAIIRLSTLFNQEKIPFSVFSFNSNTHQSVNIKAHKQFDQAWDEGIEKNIKNIHAKYSTRLGAAIRHMGTVTQQTVHQNVLIILTDGEPSDVDIVDSDYLCEDARVAVESLKNENTKIICFQIGKSNQEQSEKIFSKSNVQACDVKHLEMSLIDVMKKLRSNFG
jgi:hypothetical protein